MAAAPSYAINIFEKIAYKRDVIRAYNAKVLVNPLTGQIKYIWYDVIPNHTNGYWHPLSGTVKDLFQGAYDMQNKK